jgi:glycine cleavage system protein P-like pyridoxal-binding family
MVMLTVPNTLGLFERQSEIADAAHAAGAPALHGRANFNALMGLAKRRLRLDVLHLNCTSRFRRHGGAGPAPRRGVGRAGEILPVARVAEKKRKFALKTRVRAASAGCGAGRQRGRGAEGLRLPARHDAAGLRSIAKTRS